MKRCPKCRRDYHDDTLSFCLADGVELVYGLSDEPETVRLHVTDSASEAPTRTQIQSTDSSAVVSADRKAVKTGGVFTSRLIIATVTLAIVVASAFIAIRYFTGPTPGQIESIAVMPFVNESGNPDVEYLSDGMTETLINSLSKVPNLNVKARSSVFRYKGKEIHLPSIANELNVQAVLTGRLSQHGDNLVLSLELADTRTENSIWSEKYNRKISDVFAVQEEIASEISEKLRLKLTGTEREQLGKRSTENLKAFQYYMQGRSHVDRRTREDLMAAMRYYEKAIDEDHNYALAYAGVAEAYAQLGIRGYLQAADGREKALAAARTALTLDENLAEAHVANGMVRIVLPPHDFALGERELRRAIELSPSLAIGHYYLGVSLVRRGRLDEGLEKNRKARELDPLSPIMARQEAIHYFFKRDYRRAYELLREANELGPSFNVSWEVGVYIGNGLFDEALAEIEKEKRERIDDSILVSSTGMIYAAQGKRDDALRVVKELERMPGAHLQQAHYIAKIYATLNDKEMAFSWLERGLAAGSIGAFYKDEPVWDPIRDDPRYKDLLRRMGFPE